MYLRNHRWGVRLGGILSFPGVFVRALESVIRTAALG